MKRRDILLVDDEEMFREPIAEILRSDGFFVEEASKGKEAIDKFINKNYDLVITDMVMPGMNGVQLIQAIHKISPATEAVVLSAYGTEATKDKLQRLGVYGYLDKPVMREQLLSTIHEAIKSNRLIRLGFEKREPEVQFNRERVLVADDDSVIRELITEILSNEGYKVTSVNNGNDAVESILVNDHDLVILDINMPKMNGVEAVKEIREQDENVYILLISGEAETEEIKEALNYGADKFLPKPFKKDKLLKEIESIDFKKIKKKKGEQIKREEKQILKNYTLYHRLVAPFTLKTFRKKVVGAIILVLGGILIGALAAFIEVDLGAGKDPFLERTDQLIDAIKKDWGR